ATTFTKSAVQCTRSTDANLIWPMHQQLMEVRRSRVRPVCRLLTPQCHCLYSIRLRTLPMTDCAYGGVIWRRHLTSISTVQRSPQASQRKTLSPLALGSSRILDMVSELIQQLGH